MASREAILGALIMSLMITSTIIGLVNLAANDQWPDLFGGARDIPGALTYESNVQQGAVFFTEQNYSVANGIDPNTTKIISGHWIQVDAGYQTTSNEESIAVLNNIQPSGTTYTVKYTVDNTAGVSYFITPRFIVLTSVLGNINGQSASDIRVIFDSQGVHVKKYPLGLFGQDQGDYYFYPLPNAQNTLSTRSIITTTLNNQRFSDTATTVTSNSKLTVTKDGVTLFSTQVPDVSQNVFAYYGGFGSLYSGFNMFMVNANFYRTSQAASSQYGNIIDAVVGTLQNWFNSVTQFIGLLGAFIRYSIDSSLCPYWLSSLIIVPQLTVIGYIIAELLRGD